MAPRFLTRNKASSSTAEANEAGPSNYHASNQAERGGVVSASGRSPANLSVVSPQKLRSRNSPRHPDTGPTTFQSDQSLYPSPAAQLIKGKSTKRSASGNGQGRWMELSGDSLNKDAAGGGSKMAVPRFDSRGYPNKNGEPSDSIPLRSISRGSMVSISTAGAGFDDDMYSREYMTSTPDRPSTYFAEGQGGSVAGASIYPPVSYSLSEPSRDPYDHNPPGFGSHNPYGQGTGNHQGPLPSLYGDSKVSLASMRSEDSMTHFRKFDSMQDSYGAFSVSSKGGKRHLGEMVSTSLRSWTMPNASSHYHLILLPGHIKGQRTMMISTIRTSSRTSR